MMKISSLKLEGGALYACIETLQWGGPHGATLGPGKDCWHHLQPSQLLHLAQLHSLHSFTACSASTYRVSFLATLVALHFTPVSRWVAGSVVVSD